MSNTTVPNPSITLTRTNEGSKLYFRDTIEFTCQVQIHESVDTSVNVSMTWVREFHEQTENLWFTEHIIVDSSRESTPFNVVRDIIIDDLTSLDQRITCRSVVYPLVKNYISSSGESIQVITSDVIGK